MRDRNNTVLVFNWTENQETSAVIERRIAEFCKYYARKMRCCTLGLIAVQKHLNEMGDWILWLLVLDTCKSQKQQSNFASFCFLPQFTHQFKKEVTAQSVIDGSWNDQDFYRLLSAVHKGCPGICKATTWNGWELLVLRHLTERISLFWIGCLVGEGTRPTGPPE